MVGRAAPPPERLTHALVGPASLLVGYALAFFTMHEVAAWWGGRGYYSLWYPPAGLRLALLWRRGARWTPLVALTELAVQVADGVVDPAAAGWLPALLGVLRPPVTYGLAVWAVRRATANPAGALHTPPMPFGLAAVAAPAASMLAAIPSTALDPAMAAIAGLRDEVAALTQLVTGDLLGVLLVAPPLLWAADLVAGRAASPIRPAPAHVAEGAAVMGGALALVLALNRMGLGWPATLVLLADVWVGLRFGRFAAWTAVFPAAAAILPRTAGDADEAERITLHLGLAGVAVAGYLAGSFADAAAKARADLARRDRLLLQAERLKTLRAMSFAVIHEISQPLSTLAIEARHLHALVARRSDPEVAATAALVDRKTEALSTLVRRLRSFGGRAVDEPSRLPFSALLDTVVTLAGGEARAAGVHLQVAPLVPDPVLVAQEVELAQALVNLVRNAVQASEAGGVVVIDAFAEPDGVVVSITNSCADLPVARPGMGVGGLIARAIIEAHGGRLDRAAPAGGVVVHRVHLPVAPESTE